MSNPLILQWARTIELCPCLPPARSLLHTLAALVRNSLSLTSICLNRFDLLDWTVPHRR